LNQAGFRAIKAQEEVMTEKSAKSKRQGTRRMDDKLRGKITEEERQAYDALQCDLHRVKNRRSGVDRRNPHGAVKPNPEEKK
jgi:hypothetical protein